MRSGVMSVLYRATRDDLEQVRQRLAALAAEAEQLKALENILLLKFEVQKPQSNGRVPYDNGPKAIAKRQQIRQRLLPHDHPVRMGTMAREFGWNSGRIYQVVEGHPWFEKTPEGLVLTDAGRRGN